MKSIAQNIEDTIIELLLSRDKGKTICPSEVVRKLYPADWRDKMETVRSIGGRLAQENIIVITQKNQIVDVNVKGPIRFKLKECTHE